MSPGDTYSCMPSQTLSCYPALIAVEPDRLLSHLNNEISNLYFSTTAIQQLCITHLSGSFAAAPPCLQSVGSSHSPGCSGACWAFHVEACLVVGLACQETLVVVEVC